MVKYYIPLNYPRILLVGKKYSETPSTSTLPAVHGWETQVENWQLENVGQMRILLQVSSGFQKFW